jgi:hypothetical protein
LKFNKNFYFVFLLFDFFETMKLWSKHAFTFKVSWRSKITLLWKIIQKVKNAIKSILFKRLILSFYRVFDKEIFYPSLVAIFLQDLSRRFLMRFSRTFICFSFT